MAKSPVFYAAADDDELRLANHAARSTFGFFWREMSWERRRIIGGVDISAVKVPFHDPPDTDTVEQMWVSEINFDGAVISGVLLNEPHSLTSVAAGDAVELSLDGISDWMLSVDGCVCGAYTINAMRSQMSDAERAEHDDAWGLDFGDPEAIELVPPSYYPECADRSPANLARLEHPMAVNMRVKLEEAVRADPSLLRSADERGFTLLHQQALAGDAGAVEVLLAAGADPARPAANGMTPLSLARALGWPNVIAQLEAFTN